MCRGEWNGNSKLTKEKVLDICFLIGIVPQVELAKRYNVFPRTIRYIQAEKKLKNHFAHRIMYAQMNGIDVEDLDVKELICHSCDNGLCICPEHLWKWTHKDNAQDMIRKGRDNYTGPPKGVYVGENSSIHKLTEKDVLEIRAENGLSYSKLGKRYGVTAMNIFHIKKRKNMDTYIN